MANSALPQLADAPPIVRSLARSPVYPNKLERHLCFGVTIRALALDPKHPWPPVQRAPHGPGARPQPRVPNIYIFIHSMRVDDSVVCALLLATCTAAEIKEKFQSTLCRIPQWNLVEISREEKLRLERW